MLLSHGTLFMRLCLKGEHVPWVPHHWLQSITSLPKCQRLPSLWGKNSELIKWEKRSCCVLSPTSLSTRFLPYSQLHLAHSNRPLRTFYPKSHRSNYSCSPLRSWTLVSRTLPRRQVDLGMLFPWLLWDNTNPWPLFWPKPTDRGDSPSLLCYLNASLLAHLFFLLFAQVQNLPRPFQQTFVLCLLRGQLLSGGEGRFNGLDCFCYFFSYLLGFSSRYVGPRNGTQLSS